jgi:hypothetical protein
MWFQNNCMSHLKRSSVHRPNIDARIQQPVDQPVPGPLTPAQGTVQVPAAAAPGFLHKRLSSATVLFVDDGQLG